MIMIQEDVILQRQIERRIIIDRMWKYKTPWHILQKRLEYLNFLHLLNPYLELQSEFLDGRRTKLYPYDTLDYYIELHAPAVHYRCFEVVFDLDEGDVKENMMKITQFLKTHDIKYFLGFSGNRGYHIHVFLAPPTGSTSELVTAKGYKDLVEVVFEWILRMAKVNVDDVDSSLVYASNHTIRSFYSLNLKGKRFKVPLKSNPGVWKIPRSLWNMFLEQVKDKIEVASAEAVVDKFSEGKRRKGRLRSCIWNLINRIHEDLDHKLRVAVVTEMYHNGYSIEEIIDVFRGSPDFDEKKTRYQVEHIVNGGYKPFRCVTLKKLGVCDGSCHHHNQTR